MSLKNKFWQVNHGVIETVDKFTKKTDFGRTITATESIAFNVGVELADYIVSLHNARVSYEEISKFVGNSKRRTVSNQRLIKMVSVSMKTVANDNCN